MMTDFPFPFEIRCVAAPAILIRPLHQPGRYGIEMNITAHLQQIIVLIHEKSLVALLKDVAAATVTLVKIHGVARLKGLHHLGEVTLRGLEHQMHVVGQQTVTQKIDIFLLTVSRKLLQIPFSIVVVAKYRLAVIAQADHMVNSSRVFDPNRSRHGANLPLCRSHFNPIHLCKPDPQAYPSVFTW